MKQYCRYCVHLCVNNAPFCRVLNVFRSESSCKRTNNCKHFIFSDCPPEYQDAFGETEGYKPRERKQKQIEGQISLFEEVE